jgi:carbon storage regulator
VINLLILTRKKDEGIVIGENIEIKIVEVEGNKVKLGITAPKDISIVRKEIIEAIKNENISAGQIDTNLLDLESLNFSNKKKEG